MLAIKLLLLLQLLLLQLLLLQLLLLLLLLYVQGIAAETLKVCWGTQWIRKSPTEEMLCCCANTKRRHFRCSPHKRRHFKSIPKETL